MMATSMITSEELECRDILNDVGIFFSEESELLSTKYDDDFRTVVSPCPAMPSPAITKSVVPVSPTLSPKLPASTVLKPLNLLAPVPLTSSTPQLTLQPLPLPVVPSSMMPSQTAVMTAAGITIQRKVSDVSMTSAVLQSIPTTITNNNNRKRSLQVMQQADSMDPEEQIRRKRNREHAKKSRQRKKALTDDLRSTVEALREETEKLRQDLYKALGEDEVTRILEERKRKEQEAFIQALQQPKNRVVDGPTLKFLKGLSKKILKKQG